jgi:hypothetical protein
VTHKLGILAMLLLFDAVIDLRNLLAQGYRPVLSPDGSTLYLVQTPRCIRAGLNFQF